MKRMKIALLALALAGTLTMHAQKSTSGKSTKGEVTALSEADFAQKVYDFKTSPNAWKFEGKKPAVVDFYATWCGPCKKLAPIMDELAKAYTGKVDFYKVDVDQAKQLAQGFGLSGVPAILLIPQKGTPQLSMGLMPKDTLVQMIDNVLLLKKK